MSFTGVASLDHSIDKSNAWLAGIEEGFGTHDRRLAYRVARAWLHSLLQPTMAEPPGGLAAVPCLPRRCDRPPSRMDIQCGW